MNKRNQLALTIGLYSAAFALIAEGIYRVFGIVASF